MKKFGLILLLSIVLLAGCSSKASEEKQPVDKQWLGQWSGKIEIPQTPLPVIIELTEDGGSLSVPMQGLINYPMQSVDIDGNEVAIRINLQGSLIKIDGTLGEEQITSKFTQNGQSFPLVLKPYEPEEVSYEQFTVPVTNGQLMVALQPATVQAEAAPVAIIIAGSGPTDKNGNSTATGNNNSLKMLAEDLAQKGIASIRFDKRGVGENIQLLTKEEELSIDLYADDVVQIINTIKENQQYSSIHIIGHSEGSLIGMIAADKAAVDSFTSIAGAGRPIDKILLEQLSGHLPNDLLAQTEQILAELKSGQLVENVPAELQMLFRPSVQPYMISWLSREPAQLLQQLDIPSLIVQGKHDIQVTEVDAEALHSAKADAKLVYIDTMNHILKHSPAELEANLATYSDPALPLHLELIPAIAAFIEDASK